MTPDEAKVISEAAESGEKRYLENSRTHHSGMLVGWSEREAEVDIFGKREVWPWEYCREIRPDYNYTEREY